MCWATGISIVCASCCCMRLGCRSRLVPICVHASRPDPCASAYSLQYVLEFRGPLGAPVAEHVHELKRSHREERRARFEEAVRAVARGTMRAHRVGGALPTEATSVKVVWEAPALVESRSARTSSQRACSGQRSPRGSCAA